MQGPSGKQNLLTSDFHVLELAGGGEVRLWVVAISRQPSAQMLPGSLAGAVKFGRRSEIIMKRAAEDKMGNAQLGHGKSDNREKHIEVVAR